MDGRLSRHAIFADYKMMARVAEGAIARRYSSAIP
jgi:hypothetical protein